MLMFPAFFRVTVFDLICQRFEMPVARESQTPKKRKKIAFFFLFLRMGKGWENLFLSEERDKFRRRFLISRENFLKTSHKLLKLTEF